MAILGLENTGMYTMIAVASLFATPLIALKVYYALMHRSCTMAQLLPDYGVAVAGVFIVTKVLLQVVHILVGMTIPWPNDGTYLMVSSAVAACLPCVIVFVRRWFGVRVEVQEKNEDKTSESK